MGSRQRNKATELKELNKNKVFAKLNNCPTSPRKMRLVADQVRGKKVEKALSILKFPSDVYQLPISETLICGFPLFLPLPDLQKLPIST